MSIFSIYSIVIPSVVLVLLAFFVIAKVTYYIFFKKNRERLKQHDINNIDELQDYLYKQ